ncbi:MAG: flavodoxin/ferredoxin-NADP(+) reductase [Candidatus Westeberhardia cardiocondylae]|nr:flavodoxin/ferredoxin-NADP(+) reductase [Candidatus Westeberhardia cardiocondylae]
MDEWVIGKIVNIKRWNSYLFSLVISAAIDSFIAGQFTKLGMVVDGKKIVRSYSYVNSPYEKYLEFYLVNVKNGKFSSRLHDLNIGSKLLVRRKSSGFFVLDSVPSCKYLWMIATGTAIGPYLSILKCGIGLSRFRRIFLIHAVRYVSDLSYLPDMLFLQENNKNVRIQTIVSRENVSDSLFGRIPDLLCNGSLEDKMSVFLKPETCHVMLCGNPNMVRDMTVLLENTRGMKKNIRNNPGNITIERYW